MKKEVISMKKDVFDANRNEIGYVEYRNLTDEEINSTFRKDVEKAKATLRKDYAEMQLECQKELDKCTNENIMKILQEDYKDILEKDIEERVRNRQHTLLIIDLNGKYFHHRLYKIAGKQRYSLSRRKRGHPTRDVNCLSKEELRELRRKRKKEYQETSLERRKEIDDMVEFCDMWDAPYVDFKNIWTNLYTKEGKAIGNMEEGLDTWWGLNLQIQKDDYFRLWHYPPESRGKVDLRKYAGFDDEEAITGIFGNDFFAPLFSGTME